MHIKINAEDAANSADCVDRVSHGCVDDLQNYTGAETGQSLDVHANIPTEYFELSGQSRSR